MIPAREANIERDAEQTFARVICRPAAGVDRGRFVLVLSEETHRPARPDDVQPGKERRLDKTRRARIKEAAKEPAKAEATDVAR